VSMQRCLSELAKLPHGAVIGLRSSEVSLCRTATTLAATSGGFILSHLRVMESPIAEERMHRQRPKATEAGAPAPASTRPGCSVARRWPPR
jgi:hypothetical protein